MCDNDGVNSASRSMFTAERLVLKYRRFFRIAVPTIVAADTVRSVLVVAKLAQDRLRVRRRFYCALKRRVLMGLTYQKGKAPSFFKSKTNVFLLSLDQFAGMG